MIRHRKLITVVVASAAAVAGVLFLSQPTMMHGKVMIVDRYLSVFGTPNFDNRSFEMNDELAVAAADPARRDVDARIRG